MKIVLIQPKAFKYAPAHVYEPLNLGYLAAYLREKSYSDIAVRTAAFERDEKIVREAVTADVVGITATSPMATHGQELARSIKVVNPKATIVFGGSHPSVVPESMLYNKNIDFVVRGEGELTFHELLQALEKASPIEEIPGLSHRRNETIIHNSNRPLVKNLDVFPFVARDLIKQEQFIARSFGNFAKRSAWVLSSRGCPFSCTYCASHGIWTRSWRARSPENILNEITSLVNNYHVQHINFADDTFTVDKERCLNFCQLLRAAQLGITWACNVHANTASEELFKQMKEAGCVEIWIGVESGSSTILRELKKGSTITKIKHAFETSHKVGLRRHAYLMIGAPSESHKTIKETEKLVEEIQPDIAAVTIFTPYPGCEIYQDAKKQGYVSDNMDWSVVDLHSTVSMPTKHLSAQEVASEHKRLSAEFEKYSRKMKLGLHALTKLSFYKIRTSSWKEYPSLALKFWRRLKEHFHY